MTWCLSLLLSIKPNNTNMCSFCLRKVATEIEFNLEGLTVLPGNDALMPPGIDKAAEAAAAAAAAAGGNGADKV